MVREDLRLRFDQRRSQREIATSLALSQSTVHDYVGRFHAAGLTWPLPAGMDEAALEAQLFRRGAVPPAAMRPMPDWTTVRQELKRKGATRQLLWAEYRATAPDVYQYSSSAGTTTRGSARWNPCSGRCMSRASDCLSTMPG